MTLTDLVDNIPTAVENKLHTISAFSDVEKAFDAIDHSLLLKKLGHYGIRGIANHWLSSYLPGRKQYVETNFKTKLIKLCMECHRDQYWAQNYFFCILMIFAIYTLC